MYGSKVLQHFIKTTLLVGLVSTTFLSSGCLRKAEKAKPQVEMSVEEKAKSSADFKLVTVTGESFASSASKLWGIPTHKTYDFRACLISKATKSPLSSGQKFNVVRPDKGVSFAETDDHGCLNWHEKITFNFAADSTYIELPRTLSGRGIYKGDLPLSIGINPWLEYRNEKGTEVVDLAKVKLPDSHVVRGKDSKLSLSGLYNNGSGRDLLIDNKVQLEISKVEDVKGAKRVEVIAKIKPYIEPLNMLGKQVRYDFRKGKFHVALQLVADQLGAGAKRSMLLTPTLMPKPNAEVKADGTIIFKQEVLLNREVMQGNIHMALSVRTVDDPFVTPLKPYEGLHRVSDLRNIFNKDHSAHQIAGVFTEEDFSYGEYISKTEGFDILKKEGLARDLPPFVYEPMAIRFVRIKSGETATRRIVMYRVQTRVVDSITMLPVKFAKFSIYKSESATRESSDTDAFGILKWTDEISHLYYIPEQYFFPQAVATHVLSKDTHKFKLVLNPWTAGWTFGTDMGEQGAYYEGLNKTVKRKSLFMVDAFRYQTIRFRYVIDKNMTLNVKKAVVMAMDPLTQRYTIDFGRKGGEPLRDGIYLVKVALVKFFVDPFGNGTRLQRIKATGEHKVVKVSDNPESKKRKYVTVIKKLLRVQGGRITTPLEFSMRDLRMMSIRTNIMIQIETIDEQKLLEINIADKKIRDLETAWKAYNPELIDEGKALTEEQKDEFMLKHMDLYKAETEKLKMNMATEITDLQNHREVLANNQAARYKALQAFEDKVGNADIKELKKRFEDTMKLDKTEFEAYSAKLRGKMSDIETTFSDEWRQWNRDMDVPSNEIKDWYTWSDDFKEDEFDGVGALKIKKQSMSWQAKISENEYYKSLSFSNENPDTNRNGLGEVKSVYDYLSNLQLFMDNNDMPGVVGNADLTTMKLNNYTQNPAAPFIDLDLYRVNEGLARRSFIGPCTLIENQNLSEMRPTDTIDEKYCEFIDCQENLDTLAEKIDNKEFEDSAYHGAVKPFAQIQVDNIIDLYQREERFYYTEMKAVSQVGSFLDKYNMDYISLTDNAFDSEDPEAHAEKPKRFNNDCVVKKDLKEYNRNTLDTCYVDADDKIQPIADFLKELDAADSNSLIQDFFLYKFYGEGDEVDYPQVNTLPGLLGQVWGDFREMVEFIDDKMYDNYIEDVINVARNTTKLVQGAVNSTFDTDYGLDTNTRRYINEFEDQKLKKFDTESLTDYFNNEHAKLSLLQATKLCGLLTQRIAGQLVDKNMISDEYVGVPGKPRSVEDLVNSAGYMMADNDPEKRKFMGLPENRPKLLIHKALRKICLQSIKLDYRTGKVNAPMLSFDRRHRVIETEGYEHKIGQNMNLNVGYGFEMNFAELNMSSTTIGLNGASIPAAMMVAASKKGADLLKLRKAKKTGTDLKNIKSSSLGVMIEAGLLSGLIIASKTLDRTEVNEIAKGSSVSEGVFLVVQQATMEITLKKYERCFTSHLSPALFYGKSPEDLYLREGLNFSDKKLAEVITKGIMVCEGKVIADQPKKVIENYYYITQHFTAGDLLDDGNLLNHVWLLPIRGTKDFNKFMRAINAKEIDQDGEVIKPGDEFSYPLKSLRKNYDQVIPSFPGMYTEQSL